MHLCDLEIGDLVEIAECACVYLGAVYAGLNHERRALTKTIWYAPKISKHLPSFPIYECDFTEGTWFSVLARADREDWDVWHDLFPTAFDKIRDK